MLDIMLQVLTVLGIILLVLLAVLLIIVLLVLFFPVTYRLYGKKDEDGIQCSAKFKWLFGLLRARYSYPEWGHLTIKAICFTLYDAAIPGDNAPDEEQVSGRTEKKKAHKKKAHKAKNVKKTKHKKRAKNKTAAESAAEKNAGTDNRKTDDIETDNKRADGMETTDIDTVGTDGNSAGAENNAEAPEPCEDNIGEEGIGKIFIKFHKIKYTIYRIYDKIKKIWENISHYMELLKEEETKQLFKYALFRVGNILKHIRPRRIKANIMFGTGSPDTTGYLYGAYCMASSVMGMRIWVTPDFERAVLLGEVDASGHITLWVLVWNGCKLLLDKKFQRFLKKMKV